MNEKYDSILKMRHLRFSDISFRATGPENANNPSIIFSHKQGILKNASGWRLVNLGVEIKKKNSYKLSITLAAEFFVDQEKESLPDDVVETLYQENAIAILFPYLRSEVTLLTSQPGIEAICLPAMNIVAMFGEHDEGENED